MVCCINHVVPKVTVSTEVQLIVTLSDSCPQDSEAAPVRPEPRGSLLPDVLLQPTADPGAASHRALSSAAVCCQHAGCPQP